jgi:hypothetical protein
MRFVLVGWLVVAGGPVAEDESTVPAASDARTVAVLPLAIDGELPVSWQQTIAARLVEGMQRAGLSVVPPETHGVKSCATPQCVQGLGESAGVDFVVSSRLRVEAERRNYALEIQVSSARSGQELARLTGSCDLCGFEEAADLVEAKAGAVSDLLEKIVLGNPTVRFTSNPAGVTLEIDGTMVGQTPLAVELEPGSHRVRATLPGFMPQTFEIESVEGVSKELEFRMMAEPQRRADDDASSSKPGRGLVIAGAVLTAAGVAAIAAGAVLLAIHERPYRSRCEADIEGDCRFLYGTQTGGIVSIAIGGAAAIGGVGMIVAGKRAEKKKAAVSFGPTSIGVSF